MKKLPPLDREGIAAKVRFLMKDIQNNAEKWTFKEVMNRIAEAESNYTDKRERTYFNKKVCYFLLLPMDKWNKNFSKHPNDEALVKS